MKDQPLVEAELRETLADIYYNLAAGDNGFIAAKTNAVRALELRRKFQGESDPGIGYAYKEVARAYSREMPKDLPEFEKDFLRAIEVVRGSEGHKPLLAGMLQTLGLIQRKSGRNKAAIETYREALAIHREHDPSGNQKVWTMTNLGQLLIADDAVEEGMQLIDEGLAVRLEINPEHPDLIQSYHALGKAFKSNGENERAAGMFRKALEIGAAFMPEDHPRISMLRRDFARLPKAVRDSPTRYADASAALEKARAKHRETGDPNDLYPSILELADMFYQDKRYGEAEPLLRECRAIHVKAGTRGRKSAFVSYCLAYSLMQKSANDKRNGPKMLKEAAEVFQEAAGRFESQGPYQVAALNHRGEALARLAKWSEAADALRLPWLAGSINSQRDLQLAMLRARIGDSAGHAEIVQLMTQRYKNPKHWSNASQTLRAGSVIPSTEIDPATLLHFSKLMLDRVPRKKTPPPLMRLLQGAAEYRAGDLGAAAKSAELALAIKYDDKPSKASAAALLGIIRAQQGKLDEARSHADAARQEIKRRGFEKKGRVMSGNWPSYLYASMLLKEADAEIAKAVKRQNAAN